MRNSEYEEGGGQRRRALEQDKQMPCSEEQTRETWMRMARMVNGLSAGASEMRAR